MEKCPECKKSIETIKLLKCKFCEKNFCSLKCLIHHAFIHLGNNETSSNLVNSLKRKQSENLTEHYYFLTSGNFNEKPKYDPKYDFKNFSKVIEDFFPRQLGSGSFGRVYLVSHNETKEEFALKVINKRKLLQMYGKLDIIYNEINIHSKLEHENIIRLYNVYEDSENINMIMEYAKNGNLYELISKEKNGLSESKAFNYFIQIVNAVYYLHQNNIIHRDIKPENILIDKNNKLKLCDFGWAKELTLENRSTFCGTVEYMAPEIVGSENYDCGVDIWSLGILMYELLFGHSPFKGKNTKSIILNIKNHELTYEKPISNSCKDLIKKLLNINPQKRLKIKDILDHPFIKKYSMKLNHKKKVSIVTNVEYEFENINEKIINKSNLKRPKTRYLSSNNKEKVLTSINDNNVPKYNSTKLIDKKVLSQKGRKGSFENIKYLENFRVSLNVQLEKARKSIENMSFKNTECCTFEDFRDSQLNKMKNNLIKKVSTDKIPTGHQKHSNSHKYKEAKENKKLKEYSEKKDTNEKRIKENQINEKNELFNNNSIKKENDMNNSLRASYFNDFADNEEERAALERLNRAYQKFGKENNALKFNE